jgi:integral membrane protein (TIGR01906 family)
LRIITTVIGLLFSLAFVALLVTTNVRWAFSTVGLYELGFTRQQVSETTGLTPAQLSDAARQIRTYFFSTDEPLDVRLTVDGESISLYTERETLHMQDVKKLVADVSRVQEGAFLFLFIFATLGFFAPSIDFSTRLRKLVIRGSLITYGIIGAVAAVSVVWFEPMFRLFHELGFANDLWQLDPITSNLLKMFPYNFWLESTLLIGFLSVAEATATLMLLVLARWWQGWRRRMALKKAPQFV